MTQDFSLSLRFTQPAAAVYAAVLDVRGWWSQALAGASAAVGDRFTYQHGALHRSTHEVIEAVPGERVVWHTVDADLAHADDPREWIGTDIRFDIVPRGAETELVFTHVGLAEHLTCFASCRKGWTHYIGTSLRQRIAEGRGTPDGAAAQ